jgi:hypothetical protein
MDETRKQNKPKPEDQEAAAVADPLKITGVGAAASQNPAVTTQAKKTKPVNSGLQVGTPY